MACNGVTTRCRNQCTRSRISIQSLCDTLATATDLGCAGGRWDTIYPIYLDAKRPFQDGARRVSQQYAVEWPIAEFMAQACGMLGVEAVFEVGSGGLVSFGASVVQERTVTHPCTVVCMTLLQPGKSHPKDWDNPGRVKVQIKKDGRPVQPAIPNSKSQVGETDLYIRADGQQLHSHDRTRIVEAHRPIAQTARPESGIV